MPLPLIWLVGAAVTATVGAVATYYYSDSSSGSSRGSRHETDDEIRRQQANKVRREQYARQQRVCGEVRSLLLAELDSLGAKGHLTSSQVIDFGRASQGGPQGSGRKLIQNMAHLDLGSVESRRLVGHLLAQVDLGEKGLPVLESGVTELLELNARLGQLRQVQAGLRNGARLEDLLN